MKKLVALAALAALSACQKQPEAAPADVNAEMNADANTAANDVTNAAAPAGAAMTLLGTSWEFTREGKAIQESVDSNGNYVAVSGTEHVDHGTYAQVGGKQCFTSAMTKEGQVCWSAPAKLEVGQSAEITSDKGEKLTVKRVAYVVRKM